MGADETFILTVQKERPSGGLFLVTDKTRAVPPFFGEQPFIFFLRP